VSVSESALLARRGEPWARAVLIAKARRLVEAVIHTHQFFAPGLEHQDLVQEGLIAVDEALTAYDPSRGDWPAFCRTVVRCRLMDAVTHTNRGKYSPLNGATSLYAQGDALPIRRPAPVDELILRGEVLALLGCIARDLSPLERECAVRCLLDGEPYAGQKRIDNALQRARRKLGTALRMAA
jgi:DNA-directed RNA polymerase specialized sigma24 family protein